MARFRFRGNSLSRYHHVLGVDDAPFDPVHRGDVDLIGAAFNGARLEGVLRGRVRRDGRNATERIATLVGKSGYRPQLGLVLLQGIAMAGFNVVDIGLLNRLLDLPVIVVSRRRPDLDAIRKALLELVPGGKRKWRLIQAAGPMEAVGEIYIQRAGIELNAAATAVRELSVNSLIPEPLRTAHLIAAGLSGGGSRQRV